MFTDNTELEGIADASDECVAIQKDLNRLENWADRKFMKFDKGTYSLASREY